MIMSTELRVALTLTFRTINIIYYNYIWSVLLL